METRYTPKLRIATPKNEKRLRNPQASWERALALGSRRLFGPVHSELYFNLRIPENEVIATGQLYGVVSFNVVAVVPCTI